VIEVARNPTEFIGPAECDRKKDDGSCAGHEEVPEVGAL
jgi:hypothetical protein